MFAAYLTQFPHGFFRELARNRIVALGGTPPSETSFASVGATKGAPPPNAPRADALRVKGERIVGNRRRGWVRPWVLASAFWWIGGAVWLASWAPNAESFPKRLTYPHPPVRQVDEQCAELAVYLPMKYSRPMLLGKGFLWCSDLAQPGATTPSVPPSIAVCKQKPDLNDDLSRDPVWLPVYLGCPSVQNDGSDDMMEYYDWAWASANAFTTKQQADVEKARHREIDYWLEESWSTGELPLVLLGPGILGALMLGIGWIKKGFSQPS